jgi:hypothetical protein
MILIALFVLGFDHPKVDSGMAMPVPTGQPTGSS